MHLNECSCDVRTCTFASFVLIWISASMSVPLIVFARVCSCLLACLLAFALFLHVFYWCFPLFLLACPSFCLYVRLMLVAFLFVLLVFACFCLFVFFLFPSCLLFVCLCVPFDFDCFWFPLSLFCLRLQLQDTAFFKYLRKMHLRMSRVILGCAAVV